MRIGLIQAGGIGDIIIALPIADYFLERGCEVCWPIEDCHLPIFKAVKPEINFIPIKRDAGLAYDTPLARLEDVGCDRIIPLLSFLRDRNISDERLSNSLKFDEYKYAIAGVPFARKWDLRIQRDLDREATLKEKLNITRPYVCIHRAGGKATYNIDVPPDWSAKYQIIEISPITDSPFDWITTLEQASKLVMIDSCFANLVEQLNIQVEKYFLLHWPAQFTPVLKNGWHFLGGTPKDPPPAHSENASHKT